MQVHPKGCPAAPRPSNLCLCCPTFQSLKYPQDRRRSGGLLHPQGSKRSTSDHHWLQVLFRSEVICHFFPLPCRCHGVCCQCSKVYQSIMKFVSSKNLPMSHQSLLCKNIYLALDKFLLPVIQAQRVYEASH